MTEPEPRFRRLLRELRRRHVIRVALLYGGVCWILVEVSATVFPSLGLPAWAVTLVIVLAISGFPIALLAAWAYDLTPEGVVRADSPVPATDDEPDPQRLRRPPSIAVLPFADLSPLHDQEYLADGIAEELLNALAKVSGLRVPARTSCFALKRRGEDVRRIGETLGVDTLLEGSVQAAADRIRITVELIDARTGYHLWSEQYDRQMSDVFAIQDEIATAVVLRLGFSARGEGGQPLIRPSTGHMDAYRHYLKGRELLYRRGLALRQAIPSFERALALDPSFAAAHAGLALGYSMLGHYAYLRPEAAMPEAAERARRAVELDDGLAEGHCAHGIVALLHDWDLAAAERAFRRAISLRPGYVQARCWYGLFCGSYVQRDHEMALAEVAAAVEADPLSSYAAACQAFALAAAGSHDEAVECADAAVQRDPTAYLPRFAHAVAASWAGRYEDAIGAAETALAVSGRHWWALGQLAVACAGTGRRTDAEAIRAEFAARGRREYAQPTWHAIAALAAGDPAGALERLETAAASRDPYLIIALHGWQDLSPLRSHPRFTRLIDQVFGP